jgi:hypothetical protein
MQKFAKKFLLFFLLFFGLPPVAMSQGADNESVASILSRADSLFERQEYSKALEGYQQMLAQGYYTPQALLKMSYIQEGLGKGAQSLYSLSLLNRLSPDEATLRKLAEAGEEQSLEGYGVSDDAYFLFLFRQYREPILLGWALLALLGLGLLAWMRRRQYGLAAPAVLFVLYCAAGLWLANGYSPAARGIVLGQQVYLMDAPSAGAGLVASVGPGHRLRVLGEHDIWCEVEWQGQVAYLRRHQIQLLP